MARELSGVARPKPPKPKKFPMLLREWKAAKAVNVKSKSAMDENSPYIRSFGEENGVRQEGGKLIRADKVVDGYRCIVEMTESTKYDCNPSKLVDLVGLQKCLELGLLSVDNSKTREVLEAMNKVSGLKGGKVEVRKDVLEIIGTSSHSLSIKTVEVVRVRRNERKPDATPALEGQ